MRCARPLILVALGVLVSGCGTPPCTASESSPGEYVVTCPGADPVVVRDGTDGQDGTSCTVREVEGGAVLECSDGTTASVDDGAAGVDGEDGVDAQPWCAVRAHPRNVRARLSGERHRELV